MTTSPAHPTTPVLVKTKRYVPAPPLELDSDVVRAETPAQFRRMLARIAETAGLKPSQIAVKSGIPRSQAYALVKESPVLPRKPEQIQAFLKACSVSPAQADEVTQLWQELSSETAAKDTAPEFPAPTGTLHSVTGKKLAEMLTAGGHGAFHEVAYQAGGTFTSRRSTGRLQASCLIWPGTCSATNAAPTGRCVCWAGWARCWW
uniref:hypothetical protein n=1 Tax=Saccharothrix espanaensis TaxID=103731 RepID=UPI003F49B11E